MWLMPSDPARTVSKMCNVTRSGGNTTGHTPRAVLRPHAHSHLLLPVPPGLFCPDAPSLNLTPPPVAESSSAHWVETPIKKQIIGGAPLKVEIATGVDVEAYGMGATEGSADEDHRP